MCFVDITCILDNKNDEHFHGHGVSKCIMAMSRTRVFLRVLRVAKHLVRSSSRSASEYVPVKATGLERRCDAGKLDAKDFVSCHFKLIYIYISYNYMIYNIYII